MPTPKKGARFGSSAQHQRHILSNMAAQLIEHGAIKTTDAKAKLLRPYVEKLITRAKSGSVHDRRQVLRYVPQKDVVNYLFDELAPKFENRAGGYTRIIKLANRPGDNAPVSQISLVLEETVSAEATRATRAAASKQAEEAKAEEVQAEESEAPEVEADESTDAQVEAEAEAVEADAADADTEADEKKEDEEK